MFKHYIFDLSELFKRSAHSAVPGRCLDSCRPSSALHAALSNLVEEPERTDLKMNDRYRADYGTLWPKHRLQLLLVALGS